MGEKNYQKKKYKPYEKLHHTTCIEHNSVLGFKHITQVNRSVAEGSPPQTHKGG